MSSIQAQFSVGSVEGVPFTACTNGPDIIILASNFSRVQQISADSPISSLDCSSDAGKIAAAYDNKMAIFEPIPLVQQQQQQQQTSHTQQSGTATSVPKLDYKWVQTAIIESETSISVMSFNLEGTRLVAGGQTLQLWIVEGSTKTNWQCVWSIKTSSNISYLKYSPDGTLFCSASKSDRLVKIWYESVTNTPSLSVSNSNVFNDPNSNTTLSTPICLSPPPLAFNGSAPTFKMPTTPTNLPNNNTNNATISNHPLSGHSDTANTASNAYFKCKFNFSFIYIAHPMAVTGVEWRRTSKYTPRGAVANVLITSCRDNIARVWVQTLLPDDGLVNFNQLKVDNSDNLVNGAPRVQTQRHRQKLLRRLKRMKAFSQFKKRQALALDHSIDELERAANIEPTSPAISPTQPVLQPQHMPINLPAYNAMVTQQTTEQQANVGNTNNNNRFNQNQANNINNAALPTALSAHDFHTYAICSAVVKPGLHFHLAGTIESTSRDMLTTDVSRNSSPPASESQLSMKKQNKSLSTDEPLMDEEDADEDNSSQFVVHWINNKEIHITRSIELLLHDMLIRILRSNNQATSSSTNSPQSAGESCSGSENDTDEHDITNDDTITAESSKKLRHKLCRKMNKQRALVASGRLPGEQDDFAGNRLGANLNGGRTSPTSLVEEFDKTLEALLRKWQVSADLLFSVNKLDGTLTLWQVKYLDGEDIGVFRQVQIDELSRLKSALPRYDATTMSLNVTAYSPSAYLDVKRAYLAVTSSSGLTGNNGFNFLVGEQFSQVDVPEILSINTDSATSTSQSIKPNGAESIIDMKDCASSISDSEPSIFIVTQHLSGILGLWKLNFDSAYPKVQTIDLVTRITGLPIDPTWLRDGDLIVQYMNQGCILLTDWSADDDVDSTLFNRLKAIRQKSTQDSPSSTHSAQSKQSATNIYNFDDVKSSLNSNLASVDEETAISRCNGESHLREARDTYRASQIADIVNMLPQYHLKQLVELLAFGKIQRVKAILNHLVGCLLQSDNNSENKDVISTTTSTTTGAGSSPTPWAHRSRTLSVFAQSAPSFQDSFDIENPSSTIQRQVIEEIELDYVEVTAIRPLPLYSLLEADEEKSKNQANEHTTKTSAKEEFASSYESIMRSSRTQVDETLDEILGRSAIDTLNKQKELKRLASDSQSKGSLTSFNPKKAKLLTQVLTHTHLPGLSNIDQMHLLAVADAVALYDASPDELHNEEDGYDSSGQGNMDSVVLSTNIAIDSLDDSGLKFLTAMRQHVYLTRCLPMKQRNELKASGIGNHNLVWAFHSETQEELISLIPCVQRNKPEWLELREYGIGWWLKKLEVLRKLIEKVAQSAYQARQDPLDAALFYLAMKKKTLVCALLRRVNCDKRLLKLFEQDFNDPVNRKKALKNAYALLGLHRFEHAAAFFILAGSIWDAVEVCINNLNDIQLAMVLIRLHDNDSSTASNLKKLLFTEILGSKRPSEIQQQQQQQQQQNAQSRSTTKQQQQQQQPLSMTSAGFGAGALSSGRVGVERKASIDGVQYNYDINRAHQDPFLRSMAFWKLGDYLSSVHTLLESDVGQQRNHRGSLAQTAATSSGSTSGSAPSVATTVVATAASSRRSSAAAMAAGASAEPAGGPTTHVGGPRLAVASTTQHQQLQQQQQQHQQQQQQQQQQHHMAANTRLAGPGVGPSVAGRPAGNVNINVSASVFNLYLFLKDQPLVSKHKQQLMEEIAIRKRTSPVEEEQVHCHRARSLSSGELGFEARDISRVVKQSSTEFEVLNDTIRLIDKYSDEAIADKERVLFFSTAQSYLDAGCPLLALEVLCSEDHLNMSKAQRLKFVACLHVLMKELNTLANANQVSPGTTNGQFRAQFVDWLRKSVEAMEKICCYAGSVRWSAGLTSALVAAADQSSLYQDSTTATTGPPSSPISAARSTSAAISDNNNKEQQQQQHLHQAGPSEGSCQPIGGRNSDAKCLGRPGPAEAAGPELNQQPSARPVCDLNWIRANEPILRTMLTYCNLHSATENSLATVRLELLGLLKALGTWGPAAPLSSATAAAAAEQRLCWPPPLPARPPTNTRSLSATINNTTLLESS